MGPTWTNMEIQNTRDPTKPGHQDHATQTPNPTNAHTHKHKNMAQRNARSRYESINTKACKARKICIIYKIMKYDIILMEVPTYCVKRGRTRTERWMLGCLSGFLGGLLGCSAWLANLAGGGGSLLVEVSHVSVPPVSLDASSHCPKDRASNGHMSISSELERRGIGYGISSPRFNHLACWGRAYRISFALPHRLIGQLVKRVARASYTSVLLGYGHITIFFYMS